MFPTTQPAITDQVCHFGGVHVRIVNGVGDLVPTWFALSNGKSKQLTPIAMPYASGKIPFRLGGFVTQRASLQIATLQINETFDINRIIIWTKPLWTGYPG